MSKITQLTEDTSPTGDDLMETVQDPAGTPLSRRVKVLNLLKRLFLSDDTQLTWGAITDGQFLKRSGTTITGAAAGGGGLGDVVGPASATDNALVRYDTTTGKLIQDSAVVIDDAGAVTVPEIVAPSTPVSGKVVVYAKADGLLYSKDDAGTETLVSSGAGGGSIAPLTIIDANTVHQKNSTTVQTFAVFKSTTNNVRFSITNASNIWELSSQSDTTPDSINISIGTFKFNLTTSAVTTSSAVSWGTNGARNGAWFGSDSNLTGEYRWNNLTRIQAGVDGFPVVRADAAAANATGWIFGTNDVNGVRLKRNATRLEVKLGGDSAYTQLTCEQLGVNNSAAATTPGSVTKKIEVFDAAGNSLGFIAVYDSIT